MADCLAKKIYLEMEKPNEIDFRADRERILDSLKAVGIENVQMTLNAMRSLHPLVHEADYKVTVSLCRSNTGHDIVRVEAGDCRDRLYGIALDIGSTSLEMNLLDMITGQVIATAQRINGQSVFGLEILSRIIAVKEDRKNLDKLRELVCQNVRDMQAECFKEAGISAEDVAAMTVGGNTTMIHFFLGCDPWHVFQSPYTPVFYNPGIISAREIGLGLDCNVYCFPSVANYLGGDITSGLLLTDIMDSDEPVLFFDIGTNGELALGCKDYLLVGAGAAGPALEGEVSKSGMKAQPGAISRYRIDDAGQPHYETIGNEPARGICGSGILELIAESFMAGWIECNGNLNSAASEYIKDVWMEAEEKTVPAIFYTGDMDSDMYFTQDDIGEYLNCKAAANTMVETMLDNCGIQVGDIKKFYLAGGFGTHYDLEAAIKIGLYPDIPRDRFVILGNSSLSGAKLMLMDEANIERVEAIREKAVYLQFAEMEGFVERMTAARFFPHTNLAAYTELLTKRAEKIEKINLSKSKK